MSEVATEQPPQQQQAAEEKPPNTEENVVSNEDGNVSTTEAPKNKEKTNTLKNAVKGVHKPDFEKDVVYLYQFGRCPAIPQPSPFCFKVETWLRMNELKYEVVEHHMKYKSKKGQLPFVEVNGEEIADSEIIISKLAKAYEKDLDKDLNTEQKIISHALTSMLNNHTSWVMRWFRYRHPEEFRKATKFDIKKETNSKLPKGVLNLFFKLSFKNNIKTTVSHGLGHHKVEEIIEFGKKDLKSLSDFLGEKSFFFGDEPTLLDCEVFSHVSQFWYVPIEPAFKEFIENECSNLVAHLERMKEKYWSDWDDLCKIPEPAPPKKEEKAATTPATEEEDKEKKDSEKETSDEKEKTEEDEKEKEGDKEEAKNEEEKPEEKQEDNKDKEESK